MILLHEYLAERQDKVGPECRYINAYSGKKQSVSVDKNQKQIRKTYIKEKCYSEHNQKKNFMYLGHHFQFDIC